MTIRFNQISVGSLFKLVLICNVFFWLPIGVLIYLLALSGVDGAEVTWNGEPAGAALGLLACALLVGVLSAFGATICAVGGLVARLANRWVSFGGLTVRDAH